MMSSSSWRKTLGESKQESCYFCHAGESPWNLTSPVDLPQRESTSPPFALLVKSHRFSPRESVRSAAENLRSSCPRPKQAAALQLLLLDIY